MFYLVKTPWLVKNYMYPGYVWEMPGTEKKIYLTFDDGPHPEATGFVLDELKKFNAKASFFCIGKNVIEHPDLYGRIIFEGHSVGNHTQDHLNGWEVDDRKYFANIGEAAKHIDSSLFRPPYGRITRFQAKQVMEKFQFHIIMWSVLSGDFDTRLSPEECSKNILRSARSGSIIVFHDSQKSLKKMSYALPKALEFFTEKGYSFDKITF